VLRREKYKILFVVLVSILLLGETRAKAGENGTVRCRHQFTDSTATITLAGLKQPIIILQITDTHISILDSSEQEFHSYSGRMDRAFVKREHFRTKELATPAERFLELLATAKKHRVDLILLTGDIVNNPSKSSVAFVVKAIRESGIPTLYVSGNHDWHYEGMEGSSDQLRKTWNKNLRPLYGKHSLPAYAYRFKGITFIAIDNSTYQVDEKQLAFFKKEIGRGRPVILLSHIPYYLPGISRGVGSCGNPQWGWDQDHNYETERRERWPKTGNSHSTRDFVDQLVQTPNLIAIFTGHNHHSRVEKISESTAQYTTAAGFSGASRMIIVQPE
jgi:predicted MPP superfamily phosphohydrolase